MIPSNDTQVEKTIRTYPIPPSQYRTNMEPVAAAEKFDATITTTPPYALDSNIHPQWPVCELRTPATMVNIGDSEEIPRGVKHIDQFFETSAAAKGIKGTYSSTWRRDPRVIAGAGVPFCKGPESWRQQ